MFLQAFFLKSTTRILFSPRTMECKLMSDVWILHLCLILAFHHFCCSNAQQNTRSCTSPCNQCNFTFVCDPPPPATCIRENIALGKQVSMSSEYTTRDSPSLDDTTYAACLAFDGDRSTVYTGGKTFRRPDCIHTLNLLDEWLQVDLGKNYTVTNITVYRRHYADQTNIEIQRLANIEITVDNQQCYKFPTDVRGFPEKNYVNCTTPLTGRIVKLSTHNEYMNLCEIEVWVCKSGRYGEKCDGVCHCINNITCDNYFGTCSTGCEVGYYGSNCSLQCGHCQDMSQCNVSGHCLTGCQNGWQGSMCDEVRSCACTASLCNFSQVCIPTTNCTRENVALGKNASISSRFSKSGPACLAVNGNTGTTYIPEVNGQTPNCIHTTNAGPVEWWEVYLGSNYTITVITVFIRGDQPQRMDNVRITVDSKDCFTFPQGTTQTPLMKNVSCTPPVHGSVVRFSRNTSDYFLNFCEVQVWVCKSGLFGEDCDSQCNCKNNEVCDNYYGSCPAGCSSGYYGFNCTQTCGRCAINNTCNSTNGHCLTGCQSGWEEPMCNVCQNGFFGQQCIKCGNCRDQQPCNSTTGVCSNGCADGYASPLCNETCRNKTFGPSCSKPCGQCKNDTSCDVVNGSCAECEINFLLPLCNVCIGGFYGANCNQTCGKCQNSSCSSADGECLDGCQDGYEKPFCNETCRNNTFGQNCGLECGHCINSTQCDVFNGSCTACEPNFNLPMCTDDVASGSTHSGDDIGLIAGIVFGVILAVVILVGIILFIRRQGYFKSSEDRISRPDGSTNTFAPLSTESTDNKSTVKPKVAVKPRVRDSSSGPVYENVVVGMSSSLDKENQYQMDDVPSNYDIDVQEYDIVLENSEQLYGNDEVIYAALKSNKNLDHIQRHLVDKLTSGALLQEFKNLKKDIRKPHQTALLPQNIKKNRFKVVVPYDCNRVILGDGYEEGDATDYINASFVKGIRSDSQYIAAQGPRDNTVNDFWRMVLQERVTDIVMVTNLQEGGKSKCYEYWPAKDTSQTYGPVKVNGLDVQSRAYFFTRTFSLSGADGREHKVTQYHFTAWPDHGVPTVTSLVDFWRFVKSRVKVCGLSAPLLVHCSAGVGRTGTYIGLDIAMDECLQNGKVNIAAIVDRMRDDRTIMVQAPEQYIFLYKALLEVYTGRETKLSVHQFDAVISESVNFYTPNERIDKEFQIIMQMRSLTAEQSHSVAIADENKSKNRNESLLPSDEHVVYLTEHVPNRNQYINAVYMSTFTKSRGIILTQLPLSDTLIDFWRLIFGNEITTIVSLGGTHDETNIENFCRYWPLPEDGIQIGPYSVTLQTSSRLGKHLTMYTLILNKQKVAKSREIQLLRYEGWSSEIPDKTDLYQLVEILDTNKTLRPIVIQCTDGGTKSGLFCCIRDIISRVTFDREVDVYMTVRNVQSVRPEAVTKVEHYRFCYEVAQEKVREQNVYANT